MALDTEDMGSAVAEYLGKGGAGLKPPLADQTRASMALSLPDKPDFEAELKRASLITGVPLDSARNEPDTVKNQAKLSAFDFDTMASKFPTTSKYLADINNARIAHDDTDNLSQVETGTKSIGQSLADAPAEAVKGLGGSFNRLGTSVNTIAGAFPAAYDYVHTLISGQQHNEAGDAYFDAMVTPLIQRQQAFAPDQNARLPEKVASGVGNALGMLSQIVLTGWPAAPALAPAEVTIPRVIEQTTEHAVKSMSTPSVDAAVAKGRDVLEKTSSPSAAVKAAVAEYQATIAMGAAPVSIPGGLVKRVLSGFGLGALSGDVAHTISESGMPEEMRQPQTVDDRVVSAILGGVLGIAGPGAHEQLPRADQAHADHEAIEQLTKLAEASKLRERDVTSFEEFVQEAAKEGPVKDLYVDAKVYAETLEQKGLDPEAVSPTAAKELAAQVIAGGDVRIPLEEFVARMPGTGLDQALLEHIKTDPHGMSKKEAETYYQTFAKEQQLEAEKILGERQGDDAFKQSHEAVKAKIVEQLSVANRFTPDVNKAYASLMSSFYTTQAARLGITPEAMFTKYPIAIRAESVLGKQSMDQTDLTKESLESFANDIKVKHGVAELDLRLASNGDIRLDTMAVAKTGEGAGSRAMKDVIEYADRNGRRVVLSLAEKGYQPIERGPKTTSSERLREFYKRFGFVDNKGRNKDFTISDGMIREPIAKANQLEQNDTHGQSSRSSDAFGNDEVVHSTVSGEPAKQGWARATRILGNDGKPAPVYRGALRRLSAEDFKAEALGYKSNYAPSGLGVWFTISKREASGHGETEQFNLDIRNPKILKVGDLPGFDTVAEYTKYREELRAKGFDGIVLDAKEVGGKVHLVAFEPSQVVLPMSTLEQPAYHGSPHDFDKFRLDDATIGTGEGAQAYGHGLYFAENVDTAKSYQPRDHAAEAKMMSAYKRAESEQDYESMEIWERAIMHDTPDEILDYFNNPDNEFSASYKNKAQTIAKALEKILGKAKGRLYTVDIPEEHVSNMLDWDAGLDQQTPAVRKAFEEANLSDFKLVDGVPIDTRPIGNDLWLTAENERELHDKPEVFEAIKQYVENPSDKTLRRKLNRWFDEYPYDHDEFKTPLEALEREHAVETGELYSKLAAKLGSQQAASEYLKARGIPGIRFFDAVSRSDKSGSRNFVVFDDSIVTLTHKDGKPVTAQERKDYFQSELDQQARGQISFGDDISKGATISLLKNADLSTFLHESGHFYLEVLNDLASQVDAHPEIQQDADALMKWFGVKDLETWNTMTLEEKRPYHEQFARGFESYLFEGKAPSVELNSLFAKFRAWMVNVYKQLAALNVSLTPEVRGVMDRLVATNEEIVAAEAVRGFEPLFKTAEAASMTPDQWASYQSLGREATQEAVDQLQARSIRDMQWLTNAKSGKLKALQRDAASKRKTVRDEVTAETRKEPIYAVQRFLRHGELDAEGLSNKERKISEQAGMLGTKLSLPALKEMYGDEPAAIWRYLNFGKFGDVTAHDGLHPDMVAELFGFSSGDEMIRKILDAEPEKFVIEGKTDQRMLERYGDLSSPQAIERAANEAIHNDARSRFIATELSAVEHAVGSRRTLAKAAREFANQIVAREKIKDLKPTRYEAAEARAAKAAERGKDLNEKAVQKRNQLVNNYAARAAYDAARDVEKGARYLKKFDNANTRKSLDPDYVDQIDALLERYDLRSSVSNKDISKRASLNEWIESQRELGYEPQIPASVLADAARKPYRDMTVEEFRGLVDAVKNIEHLGRLKKKLLTAAENRDFDEVKGLLAGTIRENAKTILPEARKSDRGPLVAIGRLFKGFFASHRKFASFARQFDGWKDGGPVWDNLVRNMNERGDVEAVARENATIALHEILKPLLDGKLGEKKYYKSSGKSFTREERIGIALNMGNEINRERVMSGEKLSPDQLVEILDDLSKSDWDAIQGVWDYFDSFRPQMAAKQRRLTGTQPDWVEPSQVVTKRGTYRGGYYPIKYDPLRSSRSEADINAEVQRQIERGLYVQAQTRKGHLKARAESTGRPIRYDLGVIAEHVDQVIHDLAWHEYLIDANRLLRSGAIEDAIRTHYGPEVHTQMKDTLKDIALGDLGAQTAGDRMLNWIRHGTTISGLGLNVANTLINTIGITQSIVRVGPKWVAKGMRHWVADAAGLESSAKKIYEMSDFMRLRAKTQMREINELRNTVNAADSKLRQAYGKLLPAFFYLQTRSQQLVDIPTWYGAYEKAMVEPDMTQERAAKLADQAVRDAQGSGMTHDLSGIQRGNSALKLFTTFYHFFNTTYNMTAEAVGRTNFRKPSNVALLAADLVLLYTVPALMQTVVTSLIKGEDDKEKIAKRLIADQVSYLMAPVVLSRDLGAGAQAALGVDNGMGYTGPASIRFFSDVYALGKQINQGDPDEAFWKALDNVGGVLFHYPAGQINRTASGIAALNDGRTSNPTALIGGAPASK